MERGFMSVEDTFREEGEKMAWWGRGFGWGESYKIGKVDCKWTKLRSLNVQSMYWSVHHANDALHMSSLID